MSREVRKSFSEVETCFDVGRTAVVHSKEYFCADDKKMRSHVFQSGRTELRQERGDVHNGRFVTEFLAYR